jgi:hypothetical protein
VDWESTSNPEIYKKRLERSEKLKVSINHHLQRISIGWFCTILSIQGFWVPTPIFAQSLNSSITFKDVTEAAGLGFVHSEGKRSSLLPEDVGSGAGFADYDNDGHIDLYVVNNPGPLDAEITETSPGNVLYRNNGDGTFTDVTEKAGVGDRGYGMGCVFGDYDNDGYLDLYVTNYGANVLYRNSGDGTFADVTEKAGVGETQWGTGAAFGDYDNDGDLDLYVPNYIDHDLDKLAEAQKVSVQYGQSVPRILNPHSFDPQDNVFYRNNGDGTFTDVTTELGVESPGGRSLQAIFTDFDLDGDLELYVANDLSPNFLYRNNGDGTFTDISDASWAADFRGSMGLATGDYDGDGDLDLFMSHWIEQENALYSNMWKEEGTIAGNSSKAEGVQPIHLVDDSYGASLGEESLKYVGWGTDLFDYDNDGDLDIFVANGHTFQYLDNYDLLIPQKDQFFRYEGDGIFADVSAATGIAAMPYRVGRGTAFGDYDSDGDVDMFIVNNHGPAVLLRNEGGNRNNWLQIKLIGTTGNRDAVGARIRLQAGDRIQLREINAGASYLSFNSLTAEFGLAQETTIDWIEVIWLGGDTERFAGVGINQRIVLTEGTGVRKR